MNDCALSETKTSGKPNVAKHFLNAVMAVDDVDECEMWTSSYFECASIIRRNMHPSNKPA